MARSSPGRVCKWLSGQPCAGTIDFGSHVPFELVYSDRMSRRDADQPASARRDTVVDERGVTLTAAGRERAREQLDELDERWTPERRQAAHEAFLARLHSA